jgi:lipopolysaccharide export LptBFGC system permease protein LptF
MENKTSYLEPLFERIEEYSKTSYELKKLKVLGKTADVLSAYISRGLTLIVFSVFIVFANIGLALWLGDLTGKTYYGFVFVAAFYFVVWGVLFFFLHNWIKKIVCNSLISKMFN